MVAAAVAVETRQRAKRNKATEEEDEEEGKTPPTPPPPASVGKPRQPTPDHPPYCWMIGEAIDALGEDGGSSEGAISSFILAAHPGVPAAHDRFLRHYLAKHVAEGFFACTAPGRYARSSGEAAAVGSAEAVRAGTPVAQVKRGRGRPRKDGSSEAVRVGTPVAQVKRGRGRPRKDGSSSTPPAGKKDGRAGPSTPKRRGRPRGAARPAQLAASDGSGSVPTSYVAAAPDEDRSQATASEPRRCCRLRKLATTIDVSVEAVVTDKEDGIDAPSSSTGKEHGRSPDLELVVVGQGSDTTPDADDKVCSEAPPTMPVDCGQPRELVVVTATDVPALMPPMDKEDGGEAASFNLALMVKQDEVSGTSTAPKRSSQACELALVAADDGPVPVLVADKTDGGEAPSARCKRLRQTRKASPMVIAAQGSAPTSGKKVRGKTRSATPNAKVHRRQGKLALDATGARSSPTSVTGNRAPSVAPKRHDQPSNLYPLTAEEIPDDASRCLLALPAAANAC